MRPSVRCGDYTWPSSCISFLKYDWCPESSNDNEGVIFSPHDEMRMSRVMRKHVVFLHKRK